MKKELKRKLHAEELHGKKGKYIRSSIFGWQDGIVSAVALLAGLTGAALKGAQITDFVIILATVAEIFAGSISMSFGTYIGTKSQIEVYNAEVEREKIEI
ncbi:TPA: VIT1/CCC1 transporter family protein, partial [archaeon]|nr:VIT1/CCC1 transporter family protein [Candidatus Naiadarchaeales archaeon SRR2090153.bin1042]